MARPTEQTRGDLVRAIVALEWNKSSRPLDRCDVAQIQYSLDYLTVLELQDELMRRRAAY